MSLNISSKFPPSPCSCYILLRRRRCYNVIMPMLWWYKTSLARILALSHHPSLIRSHHQYVIWFQQKWFVTFNRKSSKINKTNIYDQWSITNSFLLDNGPMVCKQLCLKSEDYIMISQEIIHNKYILLYNSYLCYDKVSCYWGYPHMWAACYHV